MSTPDPLLAAVERLRARRDSPPPFCPGAIGAKPHAMEKCPACRLAKRVRAEYDREHPPVPLGGPPEAFKALADLLDEIGDEYTSVLEIRRKAVALASHLTEGSGTP